MSGTDDKVNAAYRSLGREEPPAALDARILAASREALVRPSASRRWAAPVSIAAVLVLAFGVTLQMQREQPDVAQPSMDAAAPAQRAAVPAAPPAAPPAATPAATPPAPASAPVEAKAFRAKKFDEKHVAAVPQAKPERNESDTRLRDQARMESERKDPGARGLDDASLAKESKDASGAPAVAAAAAPPPQAKLQAAPSPLARLKREGNLAQAPAAADTQAADEPTRELEAIAKLRVEGRHEDADKALAEFRRKRPDYRIPDAMWERVKPR
jgi:hypothetical protein